MNNELVPDDPCRCYIPSPARSSRLRPPGTSGSSSLIENCVLKIGGSSSKRRLISESELERKQMRERHTPEPWNSDVSTEDYQGCFISGNGRTIAATITEDVCKVTDEDVANGSLIVNAPALLKALRRIACRANFRQEDGAMELGERLIAIERIAKAAIELYQGRLPAGDPEEDADEQTRL